jgi:hypothetical protein
MSEQTQDQSFEEAIKAHLIGNRQKLVEQAVGHAITQMAESMKYSAYSTASEQLKTFFEKEVSPEIVKYLESQKETIIATMLGTIKNVLDAGLKSQGEEWLKEMSGSSYARNSVIQKIFSGKGY